MRNITRRLCLIFLLFSMSFSAAQDSASESKHLLGQDGHGLPPKNLHVGNEIYDHSLPVAKSTSVDNQKDDDKPPEESINSEDEVKPDSTENLPDTDLLVKSEQSDSNDDVIPLSSEDDEEISSEDDEEKSSEDVKATDNSNPDELSTVPGEEENIRHENSDDNRQNESPPQDEINEQNLGEKDIIGKTDAADSYKPESDDNQNPEDEESKHDEDPKNHDNSEAFDDVKVSESETESKDDKESEDNADLEDNTESEDTTESMETPESNILNSSENLENQDDESESVFEAEYDPNEELLENQYDESQDDFEEEDKKHDEEVAEQTSEDSEILTDRFGREMGRESSPTQKFFGLVAIIVMASMLVYFLKFQSPRLEKDETRYQPLNDVDDSPEHVRMSLINGATDDADDDDEEDEVWKWS